MNIRTYFISTAERHQYTPFLMFKSTEVNLLISVWFDCWRRWQIRRYDWSDHLSIKLFANGQLHFQFLNYKQNQLKIWAYNWYINLLRNEAPCCFQFYMNLFKKKFYERLAQIHSASVSSMRRLWIALILAFAFRQTKKITKVWALKLHRQATHISTDIWPSIWTRYCVACQWFTALCIKCRSIWKQVMEINR